MRIQFASPQTEFKCECNQCALNVVLVSSVKGLKVVEYHVNELHDFRKQLSVNFSRLGCV